MMSQRSSLMPSHMLCNNTPVISEYFIEGTANALESPRYKDVTIILADQPTKPVYHLHKLMLAATCTFFRRLFYHEQKEVYEMGSVSKRGFDQVLGYIYGQTMTITPDNFNDIKNTARYLGCEELVEIIEMIELTWDLLWNKINGHCYGEWIQIKGVLYSTEMRW